VSLERTLDRRLKMLRERHLQIEHRLPASKALTLKQQATFYSQWHYSAVRLAAGCDGMATAESIAARLRLPLEVVETALSFLVSAGLLERHGDRYTVETKRTHLSAKSPLVAVHHRNWRAKAMTMYDHIRQTDFVFTAAIALSIEDGREPTAGEPARATAGAAAEPRGLALAQAASAAVHRGSFQAARGGGASGPFARIGSGAAVRACRPAPGLGGALLRRPGRHRRALLKDAVKQRINTPPLPAADSRANELPAKDRYGKLVARVKAAVSSGKTLLHELPHDDLTPRAPGGALEG